MLIEIFSLEHFENLKSEESGLLAYFSVNNCSVCKILKPKIEKLIEKEFPKIKMVYINLDNVKELSSTYQIFTAPTILVFFEGKEYVRKGRNLPINELQQDIGRFYSLLFPE